MNLLIRPSLGLLVFFGLTIGLPVLAGQIHTAASPPPPIPAISGDSKVDPHPLDPLSPKEISLAVDLLRALPQVGKNAFFPLIALNEPLKSLVYEHKPGDTFPREAFVVILDRPAGRTFEAVVDLRGKTIRSLVGCKGVQPRVLVEEYTRAGEIVRKDKRWQEAMRKRGLKDEQFDQVALDTWAAGFVDGPDLKGARLIRTIAYLRGNSSNHYPRVIEGVIALVNMNPARPRGRNQT